MLVLVSFVLVLAAAVTLVVGLLQSGLTLIYLSIACSVLAGVVLAVAVLRGRPEPRPATAGRAFSPPPRPQPAQTTQVPAAVGASTSAETTTSWSPPPAATPPPSPPPPPASSTPAATGDDANKAAGTALLGRLRSRRAQQDATGGAEATPVPAPAPSADVEPEPPAGDETMEMPVVSAGAGEDGAFPIPDYDRLRATELLSRLPDLDRNELEAVREREMGGKNRFTIMSRIDALLAAQEAPAWDVPDEEWEPEAGTDAESEAVLIESEAIVVEDDFGTALDEDEFAAAGEVEDDEVDELVSPAGDFPIPAYETLTVGQILPRLSELDADQLAQVRTREQQGRARGTILDRVDRLAAKAGTGAGAMAMPAAAPPARKSPARKASARKTAAPAPAPAKTPAPAAKKRTRATTAADAPVAMPAATPAKKASTRKAAAAPATKAAPAKKATASRTRKTITPAEPTAVREAVKKARATKAAKKR